MVNQIISAARYNFLQSRIGNLLGVGVGTSGYNQAVTSTQVPKENLVLATEMNALYADLIKIRTHQVGTEPTALIKQVKDNATQITIANAYINTLNNNVVTIQTNEVHMLIEGLWVDYIIGVNGMTQLNKVSGYAKVLSATEFELYSNYDRTSGTPLTNPIGDVSWGTYTSGGSFFHTIGEESYQTYESLTTLCENAKHNVDSTQADPAVKDSVTRTDLWGGTSTPQQVVHEFTVTFADANNRRGFFNAGGELRFTASIVNLPSPGDDNYQKTTDWAAMLTNMGTIKFNFADTVSSNNVGTGSAIGNYDLTSSYQVIYTKTGSGVYIENDYIIYAKENSAKQIQFKVEFTDDANGSGGADERVGGELTSVLSEYRATGPYVENVTPTITRIQSL